MSIHWSLWVALVVLVLTVIILSARREGYAPPRDENTLPPYTEGVGNVVETSNNLPYVESSNVIQIDNQTQIYKDMGGLDFQIQAGNPILNFIQGDPSSNVIYGDFVAHESDGGSARMYAYTDIDMISAGESVSNTSNLVAVPENPTTIKTVYGIDVNGNLFNAHQLEVTTKENAVANLRYGYDDKGNMITGKNDNAIQYGFDEQGNLPPDAGQYIPGLTSPTIRYMGEINA